MKTMTFTYFTDPGHGWVCVRKSVLNELGIANKITPYSYMRADFAYLEEDCDAALLLDVLKDSGVKVELNRKTSNRSSRIRSYQQYSA